MLIILEFVGAAIGRPHFYLCVEYEPKRAADGRPYGFAFTSSFEQSQKSAFIKIALLDSL